MEIIKTFSLTIALFTMLFGLSPVYAEANQKAEGFVQKNAQSTLDFIGNPETTEEQKHKRLDKMINANFDLRSIGRFALGRYWRILPKENQAEYHKLFKEYVINIYSQRFNEYSGEKFEVTGSRIEQNNDTIVFSKLYAAKGNPIIIDWRIRERNGSMRVLDVIVEGVSMSLTQRSEFDSIIQRNGSKPTALLAFLEEQNAKQLARKM